MGRRCRRRTLHGGDWQRRGVSGGGARAGFCRNDAACSHDEPAAIIANSHLASHNSAMQKINLLGYLAIPLAFVMHLWLGKGKSWEPMATFGLAALGVIPLAHLMGQATEHLSEKTG